MNPLDEEDDDNEEDDAVGALQDPSTRFLSKKAISNKRAPLKIPGVNLDSAIQMLSGSRPDNQAAREMDETRLKKVNERLQSTVQWCYNRNHCSNYSRLLLLDWLESPAHLDTIMKILINPPKLTAATILAGDGTGEEGALALYNSLATTAMQMLQKQWHIFFEACPSAEAKKISKRERAALGISKSDLIYGEINFHSFAKLFWNHLDLDSGGVFYDLGSGTGRAVFAACMLHDFKRYVGIEILEGLHARSVQLAGQFEEKMACKLPKRTRKKNILFKRASFLDADWSDGDLVFANSTCYDTETMKDIAMKAEQLKIGAYIVSTTKKLKTPFLEHKASFQEPMSWGFGTFQVYQRVELNPEAVVKFTESLV